MGHLENKNLSYSTCMLMFFVVKGADFLDFRIGAHPSLPPDPSIFGSFLQLQPATENALKHRHWDRKLSVGASCLTVSQI